MNECKRKAAVKRLFLFKYKLKSISVKNNKPSYLKMVGKYLQKMLT